MAIYLDFVGLNTLIHQPISSESQNTIGYPFASSSTDYINNTVVTLDDKYHLVGLNINRNGPYGYSVFKQMRVSDNPLTRYQDSNSIFSYVTDGKSTKENDRQSFIPKRSDLKQIEESPIVSNNKPLVMIGGVSEYDRLTGKTSMERVEVLASPNNEIQFFGNEQANRDFSLDYETHESYNDLTDLYLDGGIESDGSPIDQFELLRYSHQIYPREVNSYLGHVRGRYIDWYSGFWRDVRENRTSLNVENGFGANIPSQSVWPLDVEEDWYDRDLFSTIGHFTMSSPCDFTYSSTPTSADGFKIWSMDQNGQEVLYGYLYSRTPYYWNPTTERSENYVAWDDQNSLGKYYAAKYGNNTRKGALDFYDKWIDLLVDSKITVIDPIKSTQVRKNLTFQDIFYESGDRFSLKINHHPAQAAQSVFQSNLKECYLHTWLRNEQDIRGTLYRETDAEGREKRSIYYSSNELIISQATEFEIIEEDGSSTFVKGVNDSNGILRYKYNKETNLDPLLPMGGSIVGLEWNNHMFQFGNPASQGINAIKPIINGHVFNNDLNDTHETTPQKLKELSDPFNFFKSNGDLNTDERPHTSGTISKSMKKIHSRNLGHGYLETDLDYNDAIYVGDTRVGQPLHFDPQISVGFKYSNEKVTEWQEEHIHKIVQLELEMENTLNQTKTVYLTIHAHRVGSGIVGTEIVAGRAGFLLTLSYNKQPKYYWETGPTDAHYFFGDAIANIGNPNANHKFKNFKNYMFTFKSFRNGGNGQDFFLYRSDNNQGYEEVSGGFASSIETFTNQNITKLKQIQIFDDNGPSSLPSSGCEFGDYSTGVNNSDYDTLSEVVVLRSVTKSLISGNEINGFDGTDSDDLDKYFNKGVTVDFNSWSLASYVLAWYRFGNEDSVSWDDINGTKFYDHTVHGTGMVTERTTLPNSQSEEGTENRKLYAHVASGYTSGNPCYDTSKMYFTLYTVNQGYRQKIKSVGFQTSSIGEAYLFCAEETEQNNKSDFLKKTKLAEFALIPSAELSNNELRQFVPLENDADITKKYCFVDLSTVTPSPQIWYTFDNDQDTIGKKQTIINNHSSLGGTLYAFGNYGTTSKLPKIEQDGLLIDSTLETKFKIERVSQEFQSPILQNSNAISNSTFLASDLTLQESDYFIGGSNAYNSKGGPGLLMNSYNSFNYKEIAQSDNLDEFFWPGPLYSRRHTLKHKTSFQNPFTDIYINDELRDLYDYELYQGMAFWDAPNQSGKKPFYDSYGHYAQEMRSTHKDYSIVPEFRISSHIDKFLLRGDTEFDTDNDAATFEITGGVAGRNNSNEDSFYNTYSTTDFLKMFDLVQEEHEDFTSPISIKLLCKGVKKFLPYSGFYPADRAAKISQQFYDSYKDNLFVSSSYIQKPSIFGIQPLLTPLFSPGILFNTIKSGVACDYPIMTGSFKTSSYVLPEDTTTTGSYHINEQFHKRIPFEALIEPEKYLANQNLSPQEPDPLGNLDFSVNWNGTGDEKYRLMVSNFLAETGEFFLQNKDFASISSLPEGDPNFGNAEANKTYGMRVKMFRTISGNKSLWEIPADKDFSYYHSPQPKELFSVPQDTGSMNQAFMMYSRPSAFGPPQRIVLDDPTPENSYSLKFTNWASLKKGGSELDYFYHVDDEVEVDFDNSVSAPFADLSIKTDHSLIGNDADLGYNYPFTPPYYHGEAWADILFKAPNTSKKLTLSEVMNSSSTELLRFYEPILSTASEEQPQQTNWRLVNEDAMQLASSVNLFSKGVLERDITQTKRKGIRNDVQIKVDTNVGNQYRWIIQSKFETPILNFNHIDHDKLFDLKSLPSNAERVTPIGMWHQYGKIPEKPNEGVFLQVTEIPDEWVDNAMGKKSHEFGSLIKLCGFSTDPVRLGEVAKTKVIKEAIIAVPFIEKDGQRQFFSIDREDIENALEPSTRNLVGKTIVDMTKKMKDYVFPPSMDFINNRDIDPFAMYIFEFKHLLNKQQLADIWQNLTPDIGEYHEEVESTISHELLSHELLGGKADLKPGRNTEFELNRQVRKDKIDSKIRWMVFKVKQRAKDSYFEKIFERNESQTDSLNLKNTTLSSTGKKNNATYNWPYDYFSLVELVKLEAEIDFARPDDENQEEKLVLKPYTKVISNSVNKAILDNALFGYSLPEPEKPQAMVQERIPRGKKRK